MRESTLVPEDYCQVVGEPGNEKEYVRNVKQLVMPNHGCSDDAWERKWQRSSTRSDEDSVQRSTGVKSVIEIIVFIDCDRRNILLSIDTVAYSNY